MRILLLRHGETDWNLEGRCQGITDIALNERGEQQARAVASRLSAERIDAIYSSDLKRARQTAEIVAGPHRLKVRLEKDFRELDHGLFEGLTFAEIRARYPEFLKRWRSEPADLVLPGGERLADVERRAWEGMGRLVRRHSSDATLLLVSHNFPIVSVLCRITGTPLNSYRAFRVEPCQIYWLHYHATAGWGVSNANGTGNGGQGPGRSE